MCVCVCVCMSAAVLRWNVWECPAIHCLSRHHRVTCDLLESHTGATITNTPQLGEETSRGTECVWDRQREDRGGRRELSIKPHRHSCLCVFVCFCLAQLFDGSDDNSRDPSSSSPFICTRSAGPDRPLLCSSLSYHSLTPWTLSTLIWTLNLRPNVLWTSPRFRLEREPHHAMRMHLKTGCKTGISDLYISLNWSNRAREQLDYSTVLHCRYTNRWWNSTALRLVRNHDRVELNYSRVLEPPW